VAEIRGDLDLKRELVHGTKGVVQERKKRPASDPPAALGDVRADRHCCSSQLSRQAEAFARWKQRSESIHGNRKLPGVSIDG
jgi:hypothetical protein